MSIENVKSNIVSVAVAGVLRHLNLAQVLFVEVDNSALPITSTVYVNEGVTPSSFVIEGDFRNIIAGIRPGKENAGPIFGRFTDVSTTFPIVVNLNQMNRFISSTDIRFSHYGTVAAFTYDLLEPLPNVMGNVGLSIYDSWIFSVNKPNPGVVSPPVQAAAATADNGGAIPDNTYFLKVVAVNANGTTTGSNEVSVTTLGSGEGNNSTITANWTAQPDATNGFRVYIGVGAGAESSYFTAVAGTTSLIITAIPGTAGTVPVVNTATTTGTNSQEFINVQNVTHQVASGLNNYLTTFIDATTVAYQENLADLVGA